MSLAQLSIDKTVGKVLIHFQGDLIAEGSLASKYYLKNKANDGGFAHLGVTGVEEVKASKARKMSTQTIIDAATGNVTQEVCKFSVEQRFEMIRDVCAAVARKEIKSAILSGEGGLGKSHTMLEGLELGGLKCARKLEDAAREAWLALQPPKPEPVEGEEVNDEEADDDGFRFVIPKDAFIQIKGYSTARGLYETLFEYNGRTIVFDDCDKVLTDPVAEMIFKGALDSNDERWISWNSGRLKKGVPRSFKFTGTVIFVTNMPSEDLDGPLLSRSTCIDISMTVPEKITRMRQIGSSTKFMPNVNKQVVRECMDYVESLQDQVSELNMRTLIKAVELSRSVANWKDVFEFSACR